MQLERIESGPAWADKTSPDYGIKPHVITEARKFAEAQITGDDADKTVSAWSEFIGTMDADQAAVFCTVLNTENNHQTRIAAMNILIDQFLKDAYTQRLVESMTTDYLEATR